MAFRMSDRDKAAIQAAAAIRQSNQAQADYDALMPQAMAKINQAQQGPSNPLESVLSGIGNSIANVSKTLVDIPGTTVANWIDLFQGKKQDAEGSNTQEWKKTLYGGENAKDRYAKTAGTALDAAATVSDFIPGLGTGAKVALNVGQGVASGIANPLIEKGSQATLEDAMKGALVGGASAGVGQYVGGKLANRTAGKGLISRAINSNVGKGAITGGLAGAAGGGLYAGLNGGDVIGGALQGAQGGAMAGGTMAGTMGLIGSGIDRLNRKYNAEPIQETPTPRTPAQPVADEPIAVTDRAEFDRRYKADNYRTKAAQRTLAQFGNVDAPAKRSAKAIETAKFMNGLDLFKKGDIDYAAETVTGRNGAIAQAVTKAAQDADPVKINFKNVSEGVQRGLATSSLTDAKKKAVATSINAYNDRLSSLANPDGTISPNDVLNTIRNVESDAATLLGKDGSTYRRPTSTDTRMAHVLQDYAHDLQDIVDDNVNIKGVITPELSAQLKNAQPGNQKWAEWVDKTLDGAKTVKDLRKAQAPFVRMARFAENAEAQSTNNLPTTKSAILNQAVAGIVNSNDALARRAQYNAKKADAVMASNSNGVKGKVGDVAKNIASKAGKAAEMLNNDTFSGREISPITRKGQTQTIGDVAMRQLSRQAGLGAGRYQDRQNAIQNATQEAQDIQSNYENSMLQAQQAYNQAQQTQNSIPSTLDRIGAGMERALAAGDINAYSTLANLYKQAAQMYKLQNPTTTKSEPKALSANQSKALTGLQQLQTLANMTPDLGTALANSPLGGVVDMLGGNDYANQAKSLALTLGYLQSGANITPREAENIGRAYIPSAYDSAQVRQQKLSRAEQLLRNYLADTSSLATQ